jgi:hypothetical protein
MATPQLSPGVLVREVDLTVGRADNVLDNIGAIAGPFSIGPVDEAINITTEQELIDVFGKPISTDSQYEYWLSASSFLSYGGVLKVVRTGGTNLVNANANRGGTGDASLQIKNFTDYETTIADNENVDYIFAAKSPGSWANELKVALIDDKADQIINVGAGVTTDATWVGYGVTTTLTNVVYATGTGTTDTFNGYLKGIITGINTTDQSNVKFDVKIVSLVDSDGTETDVDYAQLSDLKSFRPSDTLEIIDTAGVSVGSTDLTAQEADVLDWYDEQTIGLTNPVYWNTIAPKPGTSVFSNDRGGRNDELHVVVYDDDGKVTGINGNILEKHIGLSKATDAVSSTESPTRNWWKSYLALNSKYVYAGGKPSIGDATEPAYATGFDAGTFNALSAAESAWNQDARDVVFGSTGNVTYNLTGGEDYQANGGMRASLGDLITSYKLFQDRDIVRVDFLIMGPGVFNPNGTGDTDKYESQAKANYLISLANSRKDCVAVISPPSTGLVNEPDDEKQTNTIIEFFSPLTSSSYAVFDSGYKFTFDRFNNKFRYIPCNADVAGLMVRTGIFAYPWFSPAGQQRGVLNNAVKLAFNPNKNQRDRLYTARVNSIVTKPGVGITLFGDKTALGYASAFDRINVRRLFLTVEQALQRTAESVLFEINDDLTRANFVNIVEPYLRDVEAKRGLYGYLVICDETNNTPEVIDNNEFRADIFLKPTKSINYVQLTFIATRTGASFEEVAGTV